MKKAQKFFSVTASLCLALLFVGCGASHKYGEWSADGTSHWKYCSESSCAKKQTKFKKGAHSFVDEGEISEVNIFNFPTKYVQPQRCSVCSYPSEREYYGTALYGSKENPALYTKMPFEYVSNNDLVTMNLTEFPAVETTYYGYIDVETDGKLYVKSCAYVKDKWLGIPSQYNGNFFVYNENDVKLNGEIYSTATKSFEYKEYFISLYSIDVTAGRYYFGVTHEAKTNQTISCFQIALSTTAFPAL